MNVMHVALILSLAALATVAGCMGPSQESETIADDDYASRLDAASIRQQVGTYPAGDLTEAEKADILYLWEEEKLARDVYAVFFDRWQLRVFEQIGGAEQTHMDSVAVLIDRYALEAPSEDIPGVFTHPELQALYDRLVSEGAASEVAALRAGALVEETDLADLQEAYARTEKQDIRIVYEALMQGSRNHLRAYVRNLATRGESYTPVVLSTEEYEEIIAGPMERGPFS